MHANPRFFLPKRVLRDVFLGKVKDALKQAFAEGKIGFYGKLQHLSDPKVFDAFIHDLYRKNWVVRCRPPFGGPEQVLKYLGRYTHRVAISNHRLISFENGEVTFSWRDRKHGNVQRNMALLTEEFLRHFLLHLLPKGFVRIRDFGFLAKCAHPHFRPILRDYLKLAGEGDGPRPTSLDLLNDWWKEYDAACQSFPGNSAVD
jgi:hypothetical protein